jgi:hypothetical protein
VPDKPRLVPLAGAWRAAHSFMEGLLEGKKRGFERVSLLSEVVEHQGIGSMDDLPLPQAPSQCLIRR